jgi:hypothetical protein
MKYNATHVLTIKNRIVTIVILEQELVDEFGTTDKKLKLVNEYQQLVVSIH